MNLMKRIKKCSKAMKKPTKMNKIEASNQRLINKAIKIINQNLGKHLQDNHHRKKIKVLSIKITVDLIHKISKTINPHHKKDSLTTHLKDSILPMPIKLSRLLIKVIYRSLIQSNLILMRKKNSLA
jgi:hypothetical protein